MTKKSEPKQVDRTPIISRLKKIRDQMAVLSIQYCDPAMDDLIDQLKESTIELESAEKGIKPRKSKKETVPSSMLREVIGHFLQTYESNTGARPVLDGRTYRAARDLVKAMPVDEAKEAIDMAWEDPFFTDKIKQLSHIALNMNKYRRAVVVSPPEAKPVEVPRGTRDWELPEDESKALRRLLGIE